MCNLLPKILHEPYKASKDCLSCYLYTLDMTHTCIVTSVLTFYELLGKHR